MYAAYSKIFSRMGLDFRAVQADTGSIGGSASHEFQVLAQSGEDDVIFSDSSDFAANIEFAEAVAPKAPRAAATQEMTLVDTPNAGLASTRYLRKPRRSACSSSPRPVPHAQRYDVFCTSTQNGMSEPSVSAIAHSFRVLQCSRHRRFSAIRTAAQLLLPPPSPAATGIRFSI